MALKTQTYRPDTCDCVLIQEFDDSLPNEQIIINTIGITKCVAHQNIVQETEATNNVLTENRNKNFCLSEILENAPNTNWYDLQSDGSRTLKRNITFRWTWSGTAPNRVLTIFFDGITLTTQQRTNLQNRLNTRFGTGKIIVG